MRRPDPCGVHHRHRRVPGLPDARCGSASCPESVGDRRDRRDVPMPDGVRPDGVRRDAVRPDGDRRSLLPDGDRRRLLLRDAQYSRHGGPDGACPAREQTGCCPDAVRPNPARFRRGHGGAACPGTGQTGCYPDAVRPDGVRRCGRRRQQAFQPQEPSGPDVRRA